jgi:hypothetical protein
VRTVESFILRIACSRVFGETVLEKVNLGGSGLMVVVMSGLSRGSSRGQMKEGMRRALYTFCTRPLSGLYPLNSSVLFDTWIQYISRSRHPRQEAYPSHALFEVPRQSECVSPPAELTPDDPPEQRGLRIPMSQHPPHPHLHLSWYSTPHGPRGNDRQPQG